MFMLRFFFRPKKLPEVAALLSYLQANSTFANKESGVSNV